MKIEEGGGGYEIPSSETRPQVKIGFSSWQVEKEFQKTTDLKNCMELIIYA